MTPEQQAIFEKELEELKNNISLDLSDRIKQMEQSLTNEIVRIMCQTVPSAPVAPRNLFECRYCHKDCSNSVILEVHMQSCPVLADLEGKRLRLEAIRQRASIGFYDGVVQRDIEFLLGIIPHE